MHNKNLNSLLNLLNNTISAKSASQILSIKDKCVFLFSNFPMNGFCNSLPNYLLGIISFFSTWPEVFSSRNF